MKDPKENPNFISQDTRKRRITKNTPKFNKRKEIAKVRVEIDTRKTIEKINKTKS